MSIIKVDTRLTAQSLSGAAARFRKLDVALQEEMRNVVATFHETVRSTTSERAPVKTGFMRDHVETRFSRDRLTAETGWFRDTFLASPITKGKFYPKYPEYGQEGRPERPSLRPSYYEEAPKFRQQVKEALQRATRRAR
jgi:hypothetical protein